MSKIIETIKKHPIVVAVGAIVGILGGLSTVLDLPSKVCEHVTPYLKQSYIEDRLDSLWTDITLDDVRKKYGEPLLKRDYFGSEVWFYNSTNSFVAISFSNRQQVSQFVIAVPSEKIGKFSGFKFKHPDEYGDFEFGLDSLEGVSYRTSIEAGIGAQTGYVGAEIDPPFIIRKAGFYNKIYIESFDTTISNRTLFGVPELNLEIANAVMNCESDNCSDEEKQIAKRVEKTIPGWLQVTDGGVEKIDSTWLVEQFENIKVNEINFGSGLSSYCVAR